MDLDEYLKWETPNSNYHFNTAAIDSFFLNGMKNPKNIDPDYKKHYKLNSEGFRSEEFKNNPEILFSGCSFTYGSGIPIDYLWNKIVSENFKVSHQNLGVPGASVMFTVSNLFEHFRIYGNPKVVACLFPSFYRTFRIKNYKFGYSEYDYARHELLKAGDDYVLDEDRYYENVQNLYTEMDGPKIIKMPTDIRNIIQPDTSYYLSMMSINILEQYCKSNGINFVWSTYDAFNMHSLNIIKQRNPDRLEGLIDLQQDMWHRNFDELIESYHELSNDGTRTEIKCHQDLLEKDPYIFHMGFDRKSGPWDMHWGSHRHKHISDAFTKAIASLNIF
jgi:hypothetical protein